jgi:arsenate reductase
MAQGILQSVDSSIEVRSAGTNPASRINPFAVKVMLEIGIDISRNKPKHVEIFTHEEWDYVITVCAEADQSCPVFTGKVKNRVRFYFDDPANVTGKEEFVLSEFRRIRDQIKNAFLRLYSEEINPSE